VANKPGIQYVFEKLKDAGLTDIGVVLNNKGCEAIRDRDRLGDSSACSIG
jgi:glucose-1-phosphate thymidylyltransferase